MKKAILGIICLLTITMASVWVVSLKAAGTAPPYPPCNKVPSWYLNSLLPTIYLRDGPTSVSAARFNLAYGASGLTLGRPRSRMNRSCGCLEPRSTYSSTENTSLSRWTSATTRMES